MYRIAQVHSDSQLGSLNNCDLKHILREENILSLSAFYIHS